MSLTLKEQPVDYSTVNAPLIWVFDSTNKNTSNFKYVIDVYVGSTLVARIKDFPDPDYGYGIVDVSKILQQYIDANYWNPLTASLISSSFNNATFNLQYDLKAGEEVTGSISSGLLTYTNKKVFNTAYNYDLSFDRAIIEDYKNRPLIGSYNRTAASGEDQYITYFKDPSGVCAWDITTYNAAGGQLKVASDYLAFSSYSGPTINGAFILNVGIDRLNALITSNFIDSNTAYYVVSFSDGGSARFDIACQPRYTYRALHFLNALGGWETKSFRLVSRKSIEIERKSFRQLPYKLNSDGTTSFATSGKWREDKVNYANTMMQSMKLNAEFINDTEWAWMAQLMYSPAIYLQDGANYWPVSIKSNNYEYQSQKNGIKFLELDIEFSHQGNTQYR